MSTPAATRCAWSPTATRVYAVDNRCPHMGFPLQRGSVDDCILTCHWHHARFDLGSGGTFDQFADDVQAIPGRGARRRGAGRPRTAGRPARDSSRRLQVGLERNIRLVVAKSAIALSAAEEPVRVRTRSGAGLQFGVESTATVGWGQGLTMLTCLMNLLPRLAPEDRPRALFHGLTRWGVDRRLAAALPARAARRPRPPISPAEALVSEFVEVRDDEGAERALVTAIRGGATSAESRRPPLLGDHRPPLHPDRPPADFANKALEALDLVGWEQPSRSWQPRSGIAGASADGGVQRLAQPDRPRLAARGAFEALPTRSRRAPMPAAGAARRRRSPRCSADDPPADNFDALLAALARARAAASWPRPSPAAAIRVAQFPAATSSATGTPPPHLHVRERRPPGDPPLARRRSCFGASSTPRPASTSTAS